MNNHSIILNINEIQEKINIIKNQEVLDSNPFKMSFEKKINFFQEQFLNNIKPIINNYVTNPKQYKQKNCFYPIIYNYFYTPENYEAALFKIMGFIRQENYWETPYLLLKAILGNEHEYIKQFNSFILNSPCLDKIGKLFMLYFDDDIKNKYLSLDTIKNHVLETISSNNDLYLKCTAQSFSFNNTNNSKVTNINQIINNNYLTKEIFKIFMYAECYHDDPIYKIFLYDLDKILQKFGYDPKWRRHLCQYLLYLITIAVENIYEVSKKIFLILDNPNNQNLEFRIDFTNSYIPRLNLNTI